MSICQLQTNKPKTLSYRCRFEKCNKCTFLLKNLQSLSYECTGITDFELTSVHDTQTHPHIEMLRHLKMLPITQPTTRPRISGAQHLEILVLKNILDSMSQQAFQYRDYLLLELILLFITLDSNYSRDISKINQFQIYNIIKNTYF